MASQRTLSRLFTLHSWAGVVTGLLMFITCFSGAVVVFKHELDLWANPSLSGLPHAPTPAALQTVLDELARHYPDARPESLVLPDEVNPAYFAFIREPGQAKNVRTKVALRGDDGTLIGPVDSQLGQYIRSLHVFFFFGPRWIVGFLGVAMLMLIATGVVIHRKVLAELFTQRFGRSLRVVTSDLHKAAGIWGLAFHIVIAFTGAWLGLAPVFEQGYAHLAKAPAPTVQAQGPKNKGQNPNHTPEAMLPLDELQARALQAVPDLVPRFVALQHWGQAHAAAHFTGDVHTHLFSNAKVVVYASTGRIKTVNDPRDMGFWSQFNGLMEPLHFGDFGGLTLKWLYFFLGLTPAFLSISGTVIWLDRREQRRREFLSESLPIHGPTPSGNTTSVAG
jgi:uncharacterized iron-regulated membrane protein